jgi:fumarylacetoacetase
MKSFVEYSSDSDFSIHNIPFGVAVFNKEYIGCCTRIGDQIIDLATLYDLGISKKLKALAITFLKPIP